jgi:hypothetical protein
MDWAAPLELPAAGLVQGLPVQERALASSAAAASPVAAAVVVVLQVSLASALGSAWGPAVQVLAAAAVASGESRPL